MSSDEDILREKLRKIEALFAGAATPGERAAAGAAAGRIRARLRETGQRESAIEMRLQDMCESTTGTSTSLGLAAELSFM